MPAASKPTAIGRILASAEGFEFDAEVSFDPLRYGADTIMGLVKLANRRGRVRWFERRPDGQEWRWRASQDIIKGEDDLPTFVAKVLDHPPEITAYNPAHATLVVSFEDRSDARAFARDVDQLVVASVVVRQQLQLEATRRQQIADSYRPSSYPRYSRPPRALDFKPDAWIAMVRAEIQNASEVDVWMRRHIRERYWVGVLRADGELEMGRTGRRYWRLTAGEWEFQIGRLDTGDRLLVYFFSEVDQNAFDARYGPGQFLRRQLPAARRPI